MQDSSPSLLMQKLTGSRTTGRRSSKAGDKKHGLDISLKTRHKSGEMASLRNYLMKYLAKTFHATIPDWSPEELVFNAIAWKKGTGSSAARVTCRKR